MKTVCFAEAIAGEKKKLLKNIEIKNDRANFTLVQVLPIGGRVLAYEDLHDLHQFKVLIQLNLDCELPAKDKRF